MNPADEIANLIFYLSYCATISSEIFFPCYFGTELMLKNHHLTTAAYASNWVEFPIYLQKMVVVFMEFLKRPQILLSGKLFSLSLNSFLVVITQVKLIQIITLLTLPHITGVESNVQFVCRSEKSFQVKSVCYHVKSCQCYCCCYTVN